MVATMTLVQMYQMATIWLAISWTTVLTYFIAPRIVRWARGEIHWRKVRRHAVRRLTEARERDRDRQRWTP